MVRPKPVLAAAPANMGDLAARDARSAAKRLVMPAERRHVLDLIRKSVWEKGLFIARKPIRHYGPYDPPRTVVYCCRDCDRLTIIGRAKTEAVFQDIVGRRFVVCVVCYNTVRKYFTRRGEWPSDNYSPYSNDEGRALEYGRQGGNNVTQELDEGLLPDVSEETNGDLPGFLNLDDLKKILGKKPDTSVKIVSAPRKNEYGFVVDVTGGALRRETRSVTLRVKDGKPSLSLQRCIQAFGRKPAKWLDKHLTLSVGRVSSGTYKGTDFFKIEPADE